MSDLSDSAQQSSKLSPQISLCMIVKNEARFIKSCLQSAHSIADQLVVVDTGSTDSTPELARTEGAEVYHHPWRDSFSEARNHSLDYARGQWILILDGDETLDPETVEIIRQLDLSEEGPDAYQFEIINFTTDRAIQEESGVISQVRLFRNHPHHRYGGRVHNQIHNTETEELLEGQPIPVKVLHYGYTPAVWAHQNKDERIALHERAVAEHPDDLFVRYNYGNHLKILGRHHEALTQFIRAIPPIEVTGIVEVFDSSQPLRAELIWGLNACFLGAFCANQVKEYEIALALTEEALNRSPTLIDARVRRAEALIALERYHEAHTLLREGLLMKDPHVVKSRAIHYDAPYRMGRALYLSQKSEEASGPFASLLPNCADVTILTHLCLCAASLGLEPLWKYARIRGDLLAPEDPDWGVVDQVISNAQARPLQELVSLPIYFEEASPVWTEHFTHGLDELESNLSDLLAVMTANPQIRNHTSPYLMLVTYSDYARLTLRHNQEVLHTFPERYALPSRCQPPESAALLLTHLALLSR